MRSSVTIQNTLNIALLIEILCITYGLYVPSGIISILYVLSGICIAICLLLKQQADAVMPAKKYRFLFLLPLLLSFIFFGKRWMMAEPLSYKSADMLPVIQTMCERWLAGHWWEVYGPIPEIWHGMVPVYLPAMWLPYSVPVALGIDVRWLTVFSLLLVYWLLLRRTQFNKKSWGVITGALLLLCFLLTSDIAGLIPFSEEGIVILYYVLLVMAIQRKNAWLIGITASLCLLSRYALIGWLPAMVLYYTWRKEWKTLLQLSIAGTATSLLLVLPFGWGRFQTLLALPASYIDFARRVWNDSPEVFSGSVGLARFFGPGNIAMQHWLLIVLSLVLPSVCMLLLLQVAKRLSIHQYNIPLAVLKLTLLIFFSMVDVPYMYLFYTASFVSLFLVIESGTKDI